MCTVNINPICRKFMKQTSKLASHQLKYIIPNGNFTYRDHNQRKREKKLHNLIFFFKNKKGF